MYTYIFPTICIHSAVLNYDVGNFSLHMYLTSVLKFCSLIMAVSLNTENGTLGMGCGFGPKLYRTELNFRYTEGVVSPWVKHARLQADHTPPGKAEIENACNYTSTHIHVPV
jgi:hypothetical protein